MHILKRFLRGLCSQLFKFSITAAAVAAAVIVVFGTPGNLKNTLKTSGIYENAVDSIIDQAKKEQSKNPAASEEAGKVPIDNPAIQTAIKNALPPDFLEQASGQAIDGIFDWLEGTTDTPVFTIDLTEAKQKLASGIADAAHTKASTLPVCTAQQLQATNSENLDIFSAPCLPPNVDLQAERDKLASNIQNGSEFLKDPTISNKDLPKDNGQTVFDKASFVPTVYQWSVRLPWLLGGLALLSAGALVLLHDERRRAILVIGRSLLITGGVLLVVVAVSTFMLGKLEVQGGDAGQATIVDLVRTISSKLNSILVKFGIAYVLLGGATLLALHIMRPKSLQETPDKEPEQPHKAAETTELAKDESPKEQAAEPKA